MSLGRGLLIGGAVVVAATVALSIAVIGTPAQQRESRLDARRVNDLGRIEQEIERYRKREQGLPTDLATLQEAAEDALVIADPQTGVAYRYEVVGDREYRLCATFVTDSANFARRAEPWTAARWDHPAGAHCYRRKLDPPGQEEGG